MCLLLASEAPAAGVESAGPPQVGEAVPAFRVPGPGSQQVDLAALRGKLVYLYFWASWCPSCQQAFPWLNQLQEKLGPQGLQVVGINVDTRQADAEAFLVDHPARFAIGFDPAARLARSFDVQAMPAAFLVARDGRLAFSTLGGRPADQAALQKRIRAALASP